MKKMLLKTKILTGLLSGGILLSSVNIALGYTADTSKTNAKPRKRMEFRAPMNKQKFDEEKAQQMKDTLEAVLKEAVESQTITQTESDKILEFETNKAAERKAQFEKMKDMTQKECREYMESIKSENKGRKQKPNLFNELVEEEILTQEKADSLNIKMQDKMQELREAELQGNLDKLVENGTITTEQSDKIISAIKEEMTAKKAQFEKMKDMTQEERKQYMESIKDQHKNPIKSLVDDGTITEDQAAALRQSLPKRPMNKHHRGKHVR